MTNLKEHRAILKIKADDLFGAFPGSKQFFSWQAAKQELDAFDAAHPEVAAEIAAERKAKADAKAAADKAKRDANPDAIWNL